MALAHVEKEKEREREREREGERERVKKQRDKERERERIKETERTVLKTHKGTHGKVESNCLRLWVCLSYSTWTCHI